jgi:hypothetical protein
MVLPSMAPSRMGFKIFFISSGVFQLLVGPASSCFVVAMIVAASERATSAMEC